MPAGLGSGKTHGMCWKAVTMALANPGFPGMLVLPTYPMLRDIARPTLQRVLRDAGVSYSEAKADWNFVLRIQGEPTEIRLRSGEHPDRLQGSNLAWMGMDEAGQLKDEAFTAAGARVRQGLFLQRFIGGTPEGMTGFFYRETEGSPQPDTEVIRARTRDNPFLPEGYVERNLGHLSEAELEQYVEGRFVPAGGRVYRFDRTKHVKALPDMGGELFMGADFNVGKMVWLPARRVGGELHFFGQLVSGDTNTEEMAAKAVQWWDERGVSPSQVTVICDATGAARRSSATSTDVVLLRRAGFRVRHRSANPPVKDRVASVNVALASNRLFVSPGASELIAALAGQGYTKLGEPDKSGGLDHAADACGYVVHLLAPVTAPRGGSTRWQ